MKKCIKCRQRKGKRYCPSLGGSLCSQCCGKLREKEINCPPDCIYLLKHKPYQEKRSQEKNERQAAEDYSTGDDILKDEKLAWLVFHIEAAIWDIAKRKESFSDSDAVLALEYALGKIQKEDRLIYIPGEEIKPINEDGEGVYQNIEKCRYEKKIILPGEHQSYSNEEKIKCLERIVLSIKYWARGDLKEKNYIRHLMDHFDKIKNSSRQKKLISPV